MPARNTNISLLILDVSVISVYSKCLNVCTFLLLFSNNNVDFQNEIHRMLVRIANSEQSALGLQCLSRPFRQATSVQYFSTFTVIFTFLLENICCRYSLEVSQ